MKKITFVLILTTIMAGLSSCANSKLAQKKEMSSSTKLEMSTNLITEYGLSNEDLMSLQYYLSNDLVWVRDRTAEVTNTQNGYLVVGATKDTIKFGKDVFGICEAVNKNSLHIKFDNDISYLIFMPNNSGAYKIATDDNNTTINGLKYSLVRDKYAGLYVLKKDIEQVAKKEATGIKVN
ncbi:hypothetical protein KC852_02230 [Candidatus Nomurabacteria bacterium]|nr:hypothetical protein [Candidatus Nomurabacteria bacterium]